MMATRIAKYIEECTPLDNEWAVKTIKIYAYAKTFISAEKKADKCVLTSNVSSDSAKETDEDTQGRVERRKVMPPKRYGDSSSSEDSHVEKSPPTKKTKTFGGQGKSARPHYTLPSLPSSLSKSSYEAHTRSSSSCTPTRTKPTSKWSVDRSGKYQQSWFKSNN